MSLQIWLPMTKDLIQQGLSNITATNNGATLSDGGKLGKCYSFDGSDDYINLGSSIGSYFDTSPISFAFWIKSLENGTRGVIFGSYGSSSETNYFNIEVNSGSHSDNALRFCWKGLETYSSAGMVTYNAWVHIAVVWDGTKVSFYKNGTLLNSNAISPTSIPTGNTYYIGRDGRTGGTAFYGYLNDFRFYDHALSPKEVELLSRGLVAHYPLNGGGRGGDNIISGTSPNEVQYTYPSSSYSDKFGKTSTIIPSASQYVLSFWAKSTHAGDKVRAHWWSPNTTTKSETNQGSISTATDGQIDFTLSDKWEKYWCVWTQSSTTAVKHFIFPRMWSGHGTGTVSIKGVKLEEGTIPTPWMPNSADTAYSAMGYDSTTEYDVSGYQNNGIKTDALTYSSDTPRYSISTIFDANTDNITPSSFYSLGQTIDEMSVSIWFKTNTLNSTQPNLWSLGENSFVRMRLASATSLWYYAKVGGMPGNASTYTTKSLTDNTWHHAVYTFKAGIVTVYLDGVQVGTTNHAGNGKYMTCSNISWHIGGYSSNAEKFIGSLSDFRIYATALSAAQVAELYNTAVSVANNGTLLGYELVEV